MIKIKNKLDEAVGKVNGDELDNLESGLQTLRDSRKVGYNDGLEYGAPPKFASDVISNWKAWESTQKPTAGD